MLQTGVTLALSRMVMLLRDWAYDYLGMHPQMEVCQSAERVGHTSLDIGATLSVQAAS